ncbi:putative Phosphatidylglycerophosphatase B [Hyphomicrobiales bacterium]|nr:putative Phosphatidylglycerophosphatase B [Hyphomicrobiales bacterium]CAH1697012.1 putative Phosphatidylglycerophosphatase B [Hyphomicrobiales bacterium]CAI0344950.1 undecaprenyl-diphosphatase [Hyphomicrobiales bacterium]
MPEPVHAMSRTPAPWLQPRILIPAAAGLAFLVLAAFIASDRSFAFDTRLVLLFRDPANPAVPLGPAWFQEAVRDMTALGSFVGLFFMAATAALALWFCGYRHLAIGLAVSLLAALLASNGLKIAIGRERPDVVGHAALTFTASFPSGHAFLSAVTLLSIAGFVGLASRREDIKRLCMTLAWVMILLIGLSRIYLGVHWPTDVIGGWCLGVAWSSIAVAWVGRKMVASDPV